MTRCPKCSSAVSAEARFCPSCGAPVVEAATETSLEDAAHARRTPDSLPGSDNARFLPGSVIADRYRIVGLLGRGGMGEVYRADDLKLGQPVALKFLPQDFERDESRLQRFLNEVRLALRITHPNVCRVHDIGEIPSTSPGEVGQHYISMEYVDGEDLASLLRRIGRLPQERAVEIARQICAGLTAAHEEGILHRDLKPANIMIDGRGRARITDFGLADLSGTVHGAEVRVGTPSYMAPEQLEGSEVTERSDIYALGLVLYEMFTGKPAFAARSAAEMARMQKTAPPTGPTSLVKELDPAIESVVLRALDTDPARRPRSAQAVAAALPGGDPLAAALAAGETPSPEMVAAAGDKGGLAPGWVALLVLVIVAGTVGIGLVRPRSDVLGWIETPYALATLRERTALMVERLGFDASPAATAHGLTTDGDYRRWLREEQAPRMRELVRAGRPAVYLAWYRQSPRAMTPLNGLALGVGFDEPPLTTPGMLRIQVDPEGRLVRLEAVPPEREALREGEPEVAHRPHGGNAAGSPPESTDAIWEALFREAELDRARFSSVAPAFRPPFFADVRAAWEGTLAEAPETTIRVEAAAIGERPVSFRIVGPWTPAGDDAGERTTAQRAMTFVFLTIVTSLLTGLAILARRNLHQGRGDLKGATRIGLFGFAVELIHASLTVAPLFTTTDNPAMYFFTRLAFTGFWAGVVFLAWLALEPYVRRLWPSVLIAWSRLIAGRVRDPLVGRDVLIGAAAGVGTAFLYAGHGLLPSLLGLAEEPLTTVGPRLTVAAHQAVALIFTRFGSSIGMPMLTIVGLVLLRLLVRSNVAAVAIYWIGATLMASLTSPHVVLDFFLQGAVMALTVWVIFKVGLMAAVALWWFDAACNSIITLDPSSWGGTTAVVNLVAMAIVTGYAAISALGGRALLQDEV